MSVSIQTVSFQRDAVLSALSEGPPWTVNGIALGAGDVTLGQSGIKKVWPAEELEKAAATLQGKNLVVDHNNDSGGVVGQVTKAGYKDGVGVIYEAELFDEDLAEKINNGLLEVSIRGYHKDVDEMEENEEGAKIVTGIKFDNLSIVPTGASPSNSIDMGEHDELTAAELAAFVSELQEIEPGMWVMGGDVHGITISPVEDGEVEVDIYEETDGKWRSTGTTEMMDVNSLSEWDVDEEDIGEMQDEEENAVTSGDTPSQDSSRNDEGKPDGVPTRYAFESEEDAMSIVEEEEDLTGVHQMGDWWVPGSTHEEFTEWLNDTRTDNSGHNEDEMAPTWNEGDLVQWQVEPQLFGKIVHVDEKRGIVMVEIHERMDGELETTHFTISAGFSDLKPLDHGEGMGGHMDDEEEMAAEGEKVQWDSSDGLSRGIVVDRQRDGCFEDEIEGTESVCAEEGDPALLINIVQKSEQDGKWKKSGEMVAHNESSVEETDFSMLAELAETYDDYPEAAKENAQMALDAREETGNPNDCGTDVGWRRANQLASGESLSRDVIAKMSAFNRHRSNSDMSDEEGESDCGWMMWKAWGGDEGVDWADSKLDQIEEENGITLSDVHEEELRVEGEENPITNDSDKKKNREQSPERFIDEDEEELEGSVHEPTFSGKDDNEWNKPSLNDFTEDSWEDLSEDDKSSIGGHFIFSMSGFPAESFSDMKLPVVRPDGTLSMNAVRNAKARLSQTDGLSSDQRDTVESMLNGMMPDDEEENMPGGMERPRTIDDTGNEPGVSNDGPVDISLELINKYLRIEGHHERDTVDKMLSWLFGTTDLPSETMADFRMASKRFLDETPGTDSFSGLKVEQFRDWLLMHGDRSAGQREMDKQQQRGELPPGKATPVHVLSGDDFWRRDKSRESELDNATQKVINMTEDIEQKLAELNEPVAVEQSDLDELQAKADRFEEMSSTLESLKERTDILDSVNREQVDELADAEQPMVVESSRYEELESEAEQVKMVYAAALAEEMPAFDAEELAGSFDIEALRQKYEEHVGDLEEELSADPKSGDPSEEELEEKAEEKSEEELEPSETDEAETKREELRSKIRAGL